MASPDLPDLASPDLGSKGMAWCWLRSASFVEKRTKAALKKAEKCRKAKWNFYAGCVGVGILGNALHTVQDRAPHNCMTEKEQGAVHADNEKKHQNEWAQTISDTKLRLQHYRTILEVLGWSEKDIKCCVEQPCDLMK